MPYRSYCPACCNYRILHRFISADYFCSLCSRRIRRELLRLCLDPHVPSPALQTLIDQVVQAIQQESTGREKTTRWDYQVARAKWRPVHH